jgi:hypothetical protein
MFLVPFFKDLERLSLPSFLGDQPSAPAPAPAPTTMLGAAQASLAQHIYLFDTEVANVVSDVGAGSPLDLTLGGFGGIATISTSGLAPGCVGKLILDADQDAGYIENADWNRDADRSLELVMDIYGGGNDRSFFIGPGEYNETKNFCQLNLTQAGSPRNWVITDEAWTTKLDLGSAGLDQDTQTGLLYLCISWNEATNTIRCRGKRDGESQFNLSASWSSGASGTGKFYLGGNTVPGGGGNIHTNTTMHIHHFAVYDSVLSDEEITTRLGILEI